jgi:peptide/nickel transport system substrate-binding protein
MAHPTLKSILIGALSAAALAAPASAQKAKDTARIAIDQPIRVVDEIFNPNPESNLMDRAVMSHLMGFDVATKQYKGNLAAEWKMVDDRTIELKLRQGVKFHDGSEFDADDAVYSFDFISDPKTNYLFKDSRVAYFDKAEKVDKYTIRVRAKNPDATALARLVGFPPMLPSDVHSKLEDKESFGRKPIGTGPYRVTKLDSAAGVSMEKSANYTWGGYEPAAQIGHIEISTIPDAQTQIAKVMVDELDLIFHIEYDQAQDIVAKKSNYKLFAAPSISFTYIFFDAADRSGIKVFKDKRVREALEMAIDRQSMRKAMLPPEFAAQPPMEALCHPAHPGCTWNAQNPKYDPAAAKKLLADAGYPNGFDLELLTWGQGKPVAEAVAGDLRKVGVKASVNATTVNVFQKARGDGKSQTMITLWDNAGGQPDLDNTTQFFYADSSRNYSQDADLTKWTNDGARELDPKKREEIYKNLFSKVINERYGMPLVELPAILVVSKDLVVDTNHMKPEGFLLNRLSWTK